MSNEIPSLANPMFRPEEGGGVPHSTQASRNRMCGIMTLGRSVGHTLTSEAQDFSAIGGAIQARAQDIFAASHDSIQGALSRQTKIEQQVQDTINHVSNCNLTFGQRTYTDRTRTLQNLGRNPMLAVRQALNSKLPNTSAPSTPLAPQPTTAPTLASGPSPTIGNAQIPGPLFLPPLEPTLRNAFKSDRKDPEEIPEHHNFHADNHHSSHGDPTKFSMSHRGAVQRVSPGEGISITPQGVGFIVPSVDHRTMVAIENGPTDLYSDGSLWSATVIHLDPLGAPVRGTSDANINAAIATAVASATAVAGMTRSTRQPTLDATLTAAVVPRTVSSAPDIIIGQAIAHGPHTEHLSYCYSVVTTTEAAAGVRVNQQAGTVQPMVITEATYALHINHDCTRPIFAITGAGAIVTGTAAAIVIGGPIIVNGLTAVGITATATAAAGIASNIFATQ